MKNIKSESGFTLIELLLSMTVFSLIMIIATVGFIGMNRAFTRGVIRKQLSESAQNMNEALSRSLRANPSINLVGATCINIADNCAIAGYNSLKFGASCYFWNSNDSQGGLYFANLCGEDATVDNSTVIVEPRYVVQTLSLDPITNNDSLYAIKGALRTNNSAAFIDLNANPIVCKGSVEALSQNCAVENFAYTISSRGGQL